MKEGDGDEGRGQESMKGRGVLGSNRERKMIVCVCQWELSPLTDSVSVPLIPSQAKASLFLQSFRDTHLHCMKILVASFIYSTLPFLLLWCLGMFSCRFHFKEGSFSSRSRSRPLAPCLTPPHSVVCIFDLDIKFCCLACSFLSLTFVLSA